MFCLAVRSNKVPTTAATIVSLVEHSKLLPQICFFPKKN